jgi:hypothetical protein
MRFMISYFYQLRFFKPGMIPFSTAAWDPKWFHESMGKSHTYANKDGIICGLRAEFLSPLGLDESDMICPCEAKSPDGCAFLTGYLSMLRRYDFAEVVKYFQDYADWLGIDDPTIILLVYETPGNPCSERTMLRRWFEENEAELPEFSREESDG